MLLKNKRRLSLLLLTTKKFLLMILIKIILMKQILMKKIMMKKILMRKINIFLDKHKKFFRLESSILQNIRKTQEILFFGI